jgi:PAS domain S-box-containing protein
VRSRSSIWRKTADPLEQTRRSEIEFRDAFEAAPIGMAIIDLNGRFERVNGSLTQLTGFPAERLLTMRLSDIAMTPPGESVDATAGESASFECPLLHADGSNGWCLLRRSVVRDAAGEPAHVLLQLLDLTTRRHAEQQLAYAAEHDALTGLPNRACFERRANEALAVRRRAVARGSTAPSCTGSGTARRTRPSSPPSSSSPTSSA